MAPLRPFIADLFTAGNSPLRTHLDDSCTAGLRIAVGAASSLFTESDASTADVIIFGSDEIDYIRRSHLYRRHRSKCICITESDIPTFCLPGLYAANTDSVVTGKRTRTVSYFISERERGNPEVRSRIGGSTEKRYLYSFMGGSNSWARKRLFRSIQSRADTVVEPTNYYDHWDTAANSAETRLLQMRRYAEVMAASKFTLCPRGCGLSSYRLFESMSLGVAPVIISDKWRPIDGIDWSFVIFVRESQIHQLDQIVRSHAQEWKQKGDAGQAIYTSMLAPNVVAEMLHDNIADVLASYNPTREAIMAPLLRARAGMRESYWAAYGWAKQAALWAFYLTGRSVPIQLSRPVDLQVGKVRPRQVSPEGSQQRSG